MFSKTSNLVISLSISLCSYSVLKASNSEQIRELRAEQQSLNGPISIGGSYGRNMEARYDSIQERINSLEQSSNVTPQQANSDSKSNNK